EHRREVPAPASASASAAPMPAPTLLGHPFEAMPNGRMRIAGVVLPPSTVGQLRVRTSNGRTATAQIGPAGTFAGDLAAGPGETVYAGVIGQGGLLSPERPLGRVLPALVVADGRIELLGQPHAGFRLLSVVPGPDWQSVELVLDTWEGRLGPDGSDR